MTPAEKLALELAGRVPKLLPTMLTPAITYPEALDACRSLVRKGRLMNVKPAAFALVREGK